MPELEDVQHDLLLIIFTALAILLATGLAGPRAVAPGPSIVIP
ncbi:MAG: hypothetical protein AB1426_06815 [Bacillota bacterium]